MEEKCCKKCGSSNINFQTVNEVKLKDKHHNFYGGLLLGGYGFLLNGFSLHSLLF